MTKSKSGIVIKSVTHLATNTLPVAVIQNVFSLLPVVRYLLPLTTLNRYQPRESNGKFYIKVCIYSRFSVNRSFCQIYQNCIRAEKNTAKNLPLTGLEPLTLGLSVVLTSYSHALPTVLDPIA